MKAAAMDPKRLAHVRRMVTDNPCGLTKDQRVELLADRDHQAARADAAEAVIDAKGEIVARALVALDKTEALNAAVIAVMRRMDDDRAKLISARNESIGIARGICHGKVAARTFVLEQLRVALGLPSEWRDGATAADEAPDYKHDPEHIKTVLHYIGRDGGEG